MDERVPGIKRLKDDEERDEEKRLFDKDVEQYKWTIQCGSADNMYKDINSAVEEIIKKAEGGELSEEDKHELSLLQRKFKAIQNGSYVPTLMNNIATRFVSLEECDARKENRSFFNVIIGILTGNKAVREYVRKKYTFWLADITGQFPSANNMELESMDQIVGQIAGLIRLEPGMHKEVEQEQQETEKQPEDVTNALVVVPETVPSRLELSVMEAVRKFLEERGITEEYPIVTSENEPKAIERSEMETETVAKFEQSKSSGQAPGGEKQTTTTKEIED